MEDVNDGKDKILMISRIKYFQPLGENIFLGTKHRPNKIFNLIILTWSLGPLYLFIFYLNTQCKTQTLPINFILNIKL